MRAESSRYDNEIITTSELNSIIEEKLLSLLDGKTREKTLSESSATPLLDREICEKIIIYRAILLLTYFPLVFLHFF